MNTDKHESDDIELNPPSAKRVAQRALVLASLACRGAIEPDAGNQQAEQFRTKVVDWLKQCGAESEVEPKESDILSSSLGKLSAEQHSTATWQAEGLAILAWALKRAELPDYEEYSDAKALADSLGWLADDGVKLVQSAELRTATEIKSLADKLFALDWRLADHQLNKRPLNFEEFAKTAWFGPLNVEGLRFVNGDLDVGGVALSEANETSRGVCRLMTQQRRRAAEWLHGQTAIYSEVDLST